MQNLNTTETAIAPALAAATATPAPAKATKPAKPKASKPAALKAAKPAPAPVASDAKAKQRADAIAADDARCAKLRATAKRFYSGASLAAHQRVPATADAYASRVNKPVQCVGKSGLSQRDDSGLALALSGADKAGSFDPVALNFDLGIISRLASLGLLSVGTGGKLKLSKAAIERATLITKKAA